jgi:peptidoglycan/xylan/chitin deacetylase (PgdA/CDA1 family)
MYINKNNNFYHGLMFHHFHDNKVHKKSQGSITRDQFFKLIKFIGRNNILDSDDFFFRLKEKKLKSTDVCLTFDDGIKSQFDVALPVLEDLKIKSVFFIYSSVFEDKPDFLEVYRYFRSNFYINVDSFYKDFFKILGKDLSFFFKKNLAIIRLKKLKHPFYSLNDIKFRLVRDLFLNEKEYKKIMLKMFEEKNFIPHKYYSSIFFNRQELCALKEMGHSIGLHSHTHPTLIESLNFQRQYYEYNKNIDIISKILKIKKTDIKCMSHPCGSYNYNTLNILKKLKIDLGFKQIMSIETEKGMKKINNSSLEVSREDHSIVMRKMNS